MRPCEVWAGSIDSKIHKSRRNTARRFMAAPTKFGPRSSGTRGERISNSISGVIRRLSFQETTGEVRSAGSQSGFELSRIDQMQRVLLPKRFGTADGRHF